MFEGNNQCCNQHQDTPIEHVSWPWNCRQPSTCKRHTTRAGIHIIGNGCHLNLVWPSIYIYHLPLMMTCYCLSPFPFLMNLSRPTCTTLARNLATCLMLLAELWKQLIRDLFVIWSEDNLEKLIWCWDVQIRRGTTWRRMYSSSKWRIRYLSQSVYMVFQASHESSLSHTTRSSSTKKAVMMHGHRRNGF